MLVPNVVFTLYFLSKASLERTLVLNEDCELVFTVLEYFPVTVTATSLFPLTFVFPFTLIVTVLPFESTIFAPFSAFRFVTAVFFVTTHFDVLSTLTVSGDPDELPDELVSIFADSIYRNITL